MISFDGTRKLSGEGSPDFTLATDEGSVGVHLQHLLGKGAVGAVIGRSGHDNGEIEDLAQFGMSHDIRGVQSWVPVTSGLEKADLEIEDEEQLEDLISQEESFKLELDQISIIQSCSCRYVPKEQLGSVSECTMFENRVIYRHCEQCWQDQGP